MLLSTLTVAGILTLSSAPVLEPTGDAAIWSQYGGAQRDFTVDATVSAWPKSGPKKLWDGPLGSGYSAIVGDQSQLIVHHRRGDQELVTALEPTTGATLWEHRYEAPAHEANLLQFGAGPHATPLLLPDRVVSLGYTGIAKALDRATGKVLWTHDLVTEFGGEVTSWGFSASPILHNGLAILLVGGPQGAIALEPRDGTVRWKSEASSVSYSTPRVLEVNGREELLFFAKDALRSIDPADGSELWSHSVTNGYENHASNLLWDGEELLWVASQQEAAGRLLRLKGKGDPEVVWRNSRIRMHHWNAVLIDGVAYGSLGDTAHIFSAVDLATGKILWRDRGYGLVKILLTASGALLLSEEGDLSLVRLTPEGAELLSSSSISEELSRTVPTLMGTRLYVRDQSRIRAFELSGSKH